MVVIGFDLGNAAAYIAIARDGGIEVLTNDYSLHATPSCISFGPKDRCMGLAAKQQLSVNLKNTVINFKHLLGRTGRDPLVQAIIKYIPCEIVHLPDDKIGLKVNYLNKEKVFTPVQLMACFLVKLKQITHASTGSPITTCVFSVPYFLGQKERIQFLSAAKIAGINVVKIISDHAAVGIAYGMYKNESLPAEDKPPKIVVFVDAGHSCVQASIIAYNNKKAAVLGAAHDSSVGGLFFDDCIREHFRKQFETNYKIDAAKSPRAWQRLLDECEKIRKQMSGNSESIPLAIECFMDEIDVSGRIKRSEFEKLADHLFQKVEGILCKLFELCSDVKLDDISEVELIGGCCRIPRIKQTVADFFKRDPKTTMNLDDAAARGCALQAALLSPTVIIKDFIFQDPYDTELMELTDDLSVEINEEKEMAKADLIEQQKADARNTLEEYCYKIRNEVEQDTLNKLTDEDRDVILTKSDEQLAWLEEDEDASKEECEKRYRQLSTQCNPLIRKIHKRKEEKKEAEKGDDSKGKQHGKKPEENGQTKDEIKINEVMEMETDSQPKDTQEKIDQSSGEQVVEVPEHKN